MTRIKAETDTGFAGKTVRYAHATNCISSYFDYEAAVQMVIALLENITEDVIRSI